LDLFNVGDIVECYVDDIFLDKKKVSLSFLDKKKVSLSMIEPLNV